MAESENEISPRAAPHLIIDKFQSDEMAMALRADIESHFSKPESHKPETHQIWNYWYVENLYTYLRTDAAKLIEATRFVVLEESIKRYFRQSFGMDKTTRLQISSYFPGCFQGWHNDAAGGLLSFIYSITDDNRGLRGGNTLIMHDDSNRDGPSDVATAGTGLYSSIQPKFNQLLIFDNRSLHAVDTVNCSMAPQDYRYVVQGHVYYTEPVWIGDQCRGISLKETDLFQKAISEHSKFNCHGPLITEFQIDDQFRVTRVSITYHRIFSRLGDNASVTGVLRSLSSWLVGQSLSALDSSVPHRLLLRLE